MVAETLPEEFTAHRKALLRHCYRMMGSLADAEDAVQDALVKAWRARDTYVPEAPLVHWLMRIATTTCLTALSRRRTRGLPQLESAPIADGAPLVEAASARWIT